MPDPSPLLAAGLEASLRRLHETCAATSAAPKPDPTATKDVSVETKFLQRILNIVTGARRQAYGTPEDNFSCIAELWTAYLHRRGVDFTDREQCLSAHDVAVMMILMKCARLAESPNHEDSTLDIGGYAVCLDRIQQRARATGEKG